jgi:peptidoglycan hydrolase-like protein with peptidoglycan-binding domain
MVSYAGLNPIFAARISAAIADAEAATGGHAVVTSAYRTYADQQRAWNNYQSGRGGIAARPGKSLHEQGMAFDLAPGPVRNWIQAHASTYGLEAATASDRKRGTWGRDAPHIQLARGTLKTKYDSTPNAFAEGGRKLPGVPVDPFGVVMAKESGALPSGSRTLRKGATDAGTNGAVSQLQQHLAAKGYDIGPHGVDGKYGKDTANAVRNFEVDNHQWPADSVAGPKVFGALGLNNGAPPAYAPGGSVPPQGFPTAWGPQPPQMGPESGADPLYGRKVPTSTIGPPTIPGSPPPMGPGLPTYDPGSNALESAMGPSTAPGAPSISPDPNQFGPDMAFLSRLSQPMNEALPDHVPGGVDPLSPGIAEMIAGMPDQGRGGYTPADLPPPTSPADPEALRGLWSVAGGYGMRPSAQPSPAPAEHYPLTGDESINSVWEHIKDIPGAWARTLGFGPDQPVAAPSPAPTIYDKTPSAVSDPNRFTPSDLTPWGPGFGQSFSGLPLTSTDPSRQAAVDASAAQPAPLSVDEMKRRSYGYGQDDAFNSDMDFMSRISKAAQFTPAFYAPGRRESNLVEDRTLPPSLAPDNRGAMASSVYVPQPWDRTDIMGPTMPPMGISGGGMMNHAGGLVDMPEAFGGPGNFRPVDYASAGSANDPRAPAVSGDYPLGRRGDQISPPSANPIDMFGSDPAGASEVPMFAGKPITDTTLSGIQHFNVPSIAPAGGAPSWDNSAIYGGPDYGGTQPGYGLSAPFMAAPAPDLTVSPAGNPTDRTNKAVQAIQQATQGGGSSGGAGRVDLRSHPPATAAAPAAMPTWARHRGAARFTKPRAAGRPIALYAERLHGTELHQRERRRAVQLSPGRQRRRDVHHV